MLAAASRTDRERDGSIALDCLPLAGKVRPPMLLPLVMALTVTASPKLAIVEVDAPDVMMGLGAQVTRAIVNEAQAQKLDLVTPDQLREKLDAKHYAALKKCGARVACAAQELEALGVQRAVLGQLSRSEAHYVLKLWLFDLEALTTLSDVDRPILIAARRFMKDVEQAVPPLLRGEREARGTLVLEVNLVDAQISVNGEFAGTPPLRRTLRPGKYEVKIERKKYLPITRLIDVEANQESKLELELLLIPGQIPDDQIIPALVKKPEPAPEAVLLSPLTWALGGVTVAAAGTGFALGLVARSQENALRESFDTQTNVYGGTRTQALEQNRNAVIANVAFGVAGAALIGTVISGIVGASSAPVQVAPTVTSTAAGLTVGGTF